LKNSTLFTPLRRRLHRPLVLAADRLILAALKRGGAPSLVLPTDAYEAFLTTLDVEGDAEALEDLRCGLDETRQGLPSTWRELHDELDPLKPYVPSTRG
jgi:hypothetical protein